MQFKQRRELKRTKIEIIPMIDTMFFLLVFFILSSLGIIKLEGINVNLPKAATGQPNAKPSEITISIDRNSQVTVNAIPVPAPDSPDFDTRLQAALTAALKGAPADLATVVISADRLVPHGRVVECIDQARTVNISKFAIATTKADTPADVTAGASVPAPAGETPVSPPGPTPTIPDAGTATPTPIR